MSLSSFAALGSALAFTLGLVAVLAWLVRRYAPELGGSRGPARIQVVARANIAPRQGVATVRAEGRLMLVSFGEGGVRHVADLGKAPVEEVHTAEASVTDTSMGPLPAPAAKRPDFAWPGARPGFSQGFANILATATRNARTARFLPILLLLGALAAPVSAQAPTAPDPSEALAEALATGLGNGGATPLSIQLGDSEDALQVSGTVGTVVLIGFMTMIPTLLLLTTSFTRILIVLHLLKQALGTQTAPPAQMIAAMALLLTGFVMAPTFGRAHETAIRPWMDGEMDEVQMIQAASVPMRDFMLSQAREQDISAFLDMRQEPLPETIDDIPFVVVTSAFVTSELTSAFQMGFALFLPFVVIDVVVASVLMSMGMFMLPPVMVSLPFKLLLFVLVDGWSLIMSSLVQSF